MGAWRDLIRAPILVNFPKGMTPDPSSDWGGFALMNAANNYAQNPAIVFSNATANDLTALQVVGNGLLLRQGAPGGPVTDTLPNAVAMISQMQGPTNIPLEGTYSEPLRILNTTGQTITLATNTGLTLSGTMTIDDGTWRDFMLTPTSATAITVLNVGTGLIVSPSTFPALIVDNLTVTTSALFSYLTPDSFLFSGAGGLLSSTAAPTDGQLLIGSTGLAPVAAALTGTANQVIVTNGAGTITLSTPQDIAAGSSPTFTALTLSGLTPNSFLFSGAAGLLTSTTAPTDGQLLIGSTGLAPVLGAITGTANQVIVTNGAGTVTLSGPQDLAPASTPTFDTLTLDGNLLFNTTAQRILGDFSNATHANRLMFQSSVTDGNTIVGLIPNGTSAVSSLNVYNAPDPDNASLAQFQILATEVRIVASANGTGAFLPIAFVTNSIERLRITDTGNILVGGAAANVQAFSAGQIGIAIQGSAGRGLIELSATLADADQAFLGTVAVADKNSVAADKRIVQIAGITDGTTANNRGGGFIVYTKANGASGLNEQFRIGQNGDITGRGIEIVRTKTADTNRNTTTTLTADPDLTVSLAANTSYELTFFVVFLASVATAMGGKFALTYTGTFSGTGLGEANGDNGSWAISQRFIMNNTMINATADITTGLVLRGTIGLRTVNAGTLSIDWAQNVSNANNLSLKAGSYLNVTKLAG